MKYLILLLSSMLILREAVGPPVTTKKGEEGHEENELPADDWGRDIKYQKYLKEVVQALESDPQFKEKLEKADAVDIRTGKIARELEFVHHHVRSKLDELKRQELERLRHLAVMQYNQEQLQRHELGEAEATGGGYRSGERQKLHIAPHLDHKNPHTFEVEDLRKLIVQTTKELEDADRRRREEFKQYELQKEYEKRELLRNTEDEDQRKQMENDFKENEDKHKKHPTLHHPGSKQQLEEVWQEQDHMNPEDFNPKTFFHLHDLDGNGVWDANEVKTLFQKELDKMYDGAAAEDDIVERHEEMERMREHVFNESDTNHDRLISYDEFLAQTKKTEFEQDQGWEGLDHTPAYTHEEYEAFERQRQEEVRKLVEQGLIPPQPVYNTDPINNHPIPNHGYVHPNQVHPGQQPYMRGNQVPHHHPMASNQAYHVPPAHLNQPPQAYHPGQVQYHPAAVNHVPQQQQHPAQGFADSGGHHGTYQNQAVPHQGYPSQHPQVAHQAYAQHQQGYNQHQQHPQVHEQPAPPRVPQGQVNPGGLPHNPGSQQQQPVHQQQQPVHQQQQPMHQQQQPVQQSQPVVNQQHAPSSQHVDGQKAAQPPQGHAGNLNNHNVNSQPSNPNAGSVLHSPEGNASPSLANNQIPHSNEPPHPGGGREQLEAQNKVPSPK